MTSPGAFLKRGHFSQSGAACEQAEVEAVQLANEMRAEYWSVSAKTGERERGRHGRLTPFLPRVDRVC